MVSGPSGAGKTSVHAAGVPDVPRAAGAAAFRPPPGRRGTAKPTASTTISSPTRSFSYAAQRGEFLECFEVFGQGYWYGTLSSEVTTGLTAGKWVVLEIDVQGALAVMRAVPRRDHIFLRPSSLEELERRLRGRGTETEEAIRQRLAQAERELALADRYRYQVINDDMDQAVREICEILTRPMGEEPK